MLFNSPVFLFLFLPLTIVMFWRAVDVRARMWTLVIASLVFYGWWNPVYLPLLIASVGVNYWLGLRAHKERVWLIAGVAFNLSLLGVFKYADFVIDNANHLAGSSIAPLALALPLAISFFTFQQIAYLVECGRGRAPDRDPLSYSLFVLFFPQLIAGPIVQHKDIAPQFTVLGMRIDAALFSSGLFLLVLGLFKKVVLADGLAEWVDPAFDDPGQLHAFDAWMATLAFSLQLYFDFSAYSEMAMGIGYMFGIRLPLNFNAPYKASNITDFWRRWHMTLGAFLRDYLYVPLGGNRNGKAAMLGALLVTMLLGGLWHGPAWTFVAWGAMHGGYLVVHRLWRMAGMRMPGWLGMSVTFIAVAFSWVLFRADSFHDAMLIWQAMLGLSGTDLPHGLSAALPHAASFRFSPFFEGGEVFIMILLLAAIWGLPTVHEVLDMKFRRNLRWAASLCSIALVSFFHLSRPMPFAYFQF